MSEIDKLIALRAITTDNTGEEIYDRDEYHDDVLLKTNGIRVVKRIGNDDDPKYSDGWGYSGEYRNSVVVEFIGSLFKSNSFSGSYGRSEWTEWEPVKELQITRYYYDEPSN